MDLEKVFDDYEDVWYTIVRCVLCKNVFVWNGCYFVHVLVVVEFFDVELCDGWYVVIVDDMLVSQVWIQDGSQSVFELVVEMLFEFCGKGYVC